MRFVGQSIKSIDALLGLKGRLLKLHDSVGEQIQLVHVGHEIQVFLGSKSLWNLSLLWRIDGDVGSYSFLLHRRAALTRRLAAALKIKKNN